MGSAWPGLFFPIIAASFGQADEQGGERARRPGTVPVDLWGRP